jgi:methylation protein EvaC
MLKCKICGLEIGDLFSLGPQPLANKYPDSEDMFSLETIQEMKIFYCDSCRYVHIPSTTSRSLFFEDYYYLSSVNKELVDHFNRLADKIHESKPEFVLDVGSNDGILLKPLQALNIKCVGIDPSENVSRLANQAGLETIVGFFNSESAEHIRKHYGCPDTICASSVFTHLEDPGGFFSVADSLLAEGGEIIIEVEYLGSIIENLGFERFYFDRPHYYSITSLEKIGQKNGFTLIDVEAIPAHGGSVRAIFSRSGYALKQKFSVKTQKVIEKRLVSRDMILQKFSVFQSECYRLKEQLKQHKVKGVTVAGYGCPARFSTITNFAGIDSELLKHVVDDSHLKQGRFSPGVHVPIISFLESEGVDIYIVFAYEYIQSIREKCGNSKVNFFKPIPLQQL